MAGIRAVKKNVRIRIAGMDMLGFGCELMPLKNTSEARDTKLSMACPDCAAQGVPMPMKQFYTGATCHHAPPGEPGYTVSQVPDKLRMEGKKPVLILAAELAALQEDAISDGPTIVDLTVEKRTAVDAATYPAGNVYWVEPDGPNSVYTVFCDLANDPEHALIGTLTLRGTPQLVELVPHRGGIVLTQLLRPSEVYVYNPQKIEAKDQEKAMAAKLIAALANDEFDAEAYNSERTKRVRELIEAKLAGSPVATAAVDAPKTKAATVDLTSALEAALAAVQAKKGA